jgi:circadian clock protein KaiB
MDESTLTPKQVVEDSQKEFYVLQLYITGTTPNSQRAVINIKKICEQYLQERYTLEVIDLYQQSTLAEGERIIAIPTLIKKKPDPVRYIIGDLSDTINVLEGLGLKVIHNKK